MAKYYKRQRQKAKVRKSSVDMEVCNLRAKDNIKFLINKLYDKNKKKKQDKK